MIALILQAAFAAPIDTVQPVTTRAGFLRFDDDRFADAAGLDAIEARLLTSTDARERSALAEWFGRVARQLDAAPRAVQLALDSPHAEVRRTLLETLQRAPEAELQPLYALTADAEPTVRAAALTLVASRASDQRAGLLSAALEDADPRVRATAIENLRIYTIQAPVHALVADQDADVRLQAALYLKRHEPDIFAETRASLAVDPDPRVRRTATSGAGLR